MFEVKVYVVQHESGEVVALKLTRDADLMIKVA